MAMLQSEIPKIHNIWEHKNYGQTTVNLEMFIWLDSLFKWFYLHKIIF